MLSNIVLENYFWQIYAISSQLLGTQRVKKGNKNVTLILLSHLKELMKNGLRDLFIFKRMDDCMHEELMKQEQK